MIAAASSAFVIFVQQLMSYLSDLLIQPKQGLDGTKEAVKKNFPESKKVNTEDQSFVSDEKSFILTSYYLSYKL